jgi:hypothetical protein
MAATATRTRRKGDRLSELHEQLTEENRYLSLCLVFRRKTTKEILLKVGGQWDQLEESYTEAEATSCLIIDVKENQVEIVRKFRRWLEAYFAGGRRERILLTGGSRRGGKSFITTALICAIAIAIPGAICWMVSPTILKRDELERYVKRHTLREWRSAYRGMPEYRFTLANGSTIQSITGDTYDALKRGQSTAILYNEPQVCAVDVATNGLPSLIDQGGLALFAGNPATRAKGYWFNELRQAILDGEYVWPDGTPKGSFFDVPSDLNDDIDQAARQDFGQLLHILDPEAAKRDDQGLWLTIGERAYEMWRRRPRVVDGEELPGLVGELPDIGFTDITSQALREAGVWRSSGKTYDWAIGADFQGRPHMAALAAKILKGPDGKRWYYFRHEITARGDEDDLSFELEERGFTPDNAAIVGDASGEYQASKDRKHQLPSWQRLQAHRWTVIPPREKQRAESKYSSNPPVDLSVGQMFVVMRESRILVHPECEWLIESFEKCPASRQGSRLIIPSKGGYSHITDCARYLVWRFEPKPKRAASSNGPRGATFPKMRPGAGFNL